MSHHRFAADCANESTERTRDSTDSQLFVTIAPEAAETLYQVLEASEAGGLATQGYGIGHGAEDHDSYESIFADDGGSARPSAATAATSVSEKR